MSIDPTMWWQRLEPRPRENSIEKGLAAEIRDPLWMLGRQWQVGEFMGEDTGTPSDVRVVMSWTRPNRITAEGWEEAIPDAGDLERKATRVSAADQAQAQASIELGDVLRQMLEEANAWDWFSNHLDSLPLRPIDGVGLDGISAAEHIDLIRAEILPLAPPELEGPIHLAFEEYEHWLAATLGLNSHAGPWRPAMLDYYARVDTPLPNGDQARIAVRPDEDARVDWHAFEMEEIHPGNNPKETETFHRPPMRVSYPGMPHRRWWRFEDSKIALPQLKPDKRDLAMLLLLDFALVAGADWFLVPVQVPRDRFVQVEQLHVTDVFGEEFSSQAVNADSSWQLFSLSASRGQAMDVLYAGGPLPSTDGETTDKLRFLRDEINNLVWAVEEQLLVDGKPRSGVDIHVAATAHPPILKENVTLSDPGDPRYVTEHPAPEHWWPFAAVSASGTTTLVRARLSGRTGKPRLPDLRLYDHDQTLMQHAVPSMGIQISHEKRLTRLPSGKARLQQVRIRRVGAGDERSGLKFDYLEAQSK